MKAADGKGSGWLLLGLIGLILILAGGTALWLGGFAPGGRGGDDRPGVGPAGYPLPEFSLTDQENRTITADSLRGKVLVVDFIYTHCPDVCPLLTAFMAGLQDRLAEEGLLGSDVRLLSFTSDPFRDSPEVLREYAAAYGADPDAWHFLTGPAGPQLELIAEGFKLAVGFVDTEGKVVDPFQERPERYEVIHSSRFLLVGRDGTVERTYHFPDFRMEDLLADVRRAARP